MVPDAARASQPGGTDEVEVRDDDEGTSALRFFVVVVLYRMDLASSPTIASLVAAAGSLERSTVLIWDNGPNPQDAAELARVGDLAAWRIDYVHAPDNAGLPAVYGAAIDRARDHDVVVLLDQDSGLPSDYFEHVRAACHAQPECAVFLPIVESHGRIVSPGSYRWIKGRYWRTARHGLVAAVGLTAINSGMAVRRTYLAEEFPGYDPRLRFYGVDTAFMLDHARRRRHAFVMECVVRHASALLETNAPATERVRRNAALFESWVLVHEASIVRSVLVRFYVLYVGLREAIRSRDLRFVAAAGAAALGRRGA